MFVDTPVFVEEINQLFNCEYDSAKTIVQINRSTFVYLMSYLLLKKLFICLKKVNHMVNFKDLIKNESKHNEADTNFGHYLSYEDSWSILEHPVYLYTR